MLEPSNSRQNKRNKIIEQNSIFNGPYSKDQRHNGTGNAWNSNRPRETELENKDQAEKHYGKSIQKFLLKKCKKKLFANN